MLAAEISTESLDTANLQPMVSRRRGRTRTPPASPTALGVVLADAGYWKNSAIEALSGQGSQPLVAPDADRRKEPRPGRRGGLYDFIRRVLATDWGAELYRRRQGDRRARLRPDQGQPRRRPLPAPRPISRQIRMAAARDHPQPAQAPPPPARERLT